MASISSIEMTLVVVTSSPALRLTIWREHLAAEFDEMRDTRFCHRNRGFAPADAAGDLFD